jgi:cysteine-rich repeat protein
MTAKLALRLLVLTSLAAPSVAFALPGSPQFVPNGDESWGAPENSAAINSQLTAFGYENYCLTCHNNPDGGRGCANPTPTMGSPRTATDWSAWGVCLDRGCSDTGNAGDAPCLNSFGQRFQVVRAEGLAAGIPSTEWWPDIYDEDSDGDGLTNGEELGDPTGSWRIGDPMPPVLSHPGDGGTTSPVVDICCIGGPTDHDFDECALNIDQCAQGTCANEVARGPSYTCTCAAGFEGEYCHLDIDECESATICGANGTCENLPGSYQCNCDAGWTGAACNTCATGFEGGSCADVDECATDPCDENASCVNEPGTYTCTCDEGWEGDGTTCTDADDCRSDSCGANEVCVNEVGAPFSCECAAGFAGAPCAETCGDGMKGPSEDCDDGDTDDGDGCSATCDEEPLFTCMGAVGEMSSCTMDTLPAIDAGMIPQTDAGMTDAGMVEEDGGCSAAPGRSSIPAWLWLAPLALVVLWRRRR